MYAVSPGYFRTMGIRLIDGRLFSNYDGNIAKLSHIRICANEGTLVKTGIVRYCRPAGSIYQIGIEFCEADL